MVDCSIVWQMRDECIFRASLDPSSCAKDGLSSLGNLLKESEKDRSDSWAREFGR